MCAAGSLGPRRRRSHHPGAREPHAARVGPHAERHGVDSGVPSDQRVRLLRGQVHKAVARTDLVRLAILPGEAGAAQDEEDLLLGQLDVRGRRALAGVDLPAGDTDRDASGGRAEIGLGRRRARRARRGCSPPRPDARRSPSRWRLYASTRASAVAAAASTTTSASGTRAAIATAPAPTPASRASSTSSLSPPTVWVTTSAARSTGASSVTAPASDPGSRRRPSSTGPVALSATVAAPTTRTTTQTALTTASPVRAGTPCR